MSKQRNCSAVIEEMLQHIPSNHYEFIEDLKWNQDDAKYKAPEETIQWFRTQNTLMKHIPIPKNEWEFHVLSIFTTLPVEEIKHHVNNTNYGKF